ncbi:MAG TPA: LysM peptidoglycan-binding domain-containing protein [Candidatus Acidoferrales bacterium]|nr:LysM peptidoglycan-binding domain-containing protein [Candidatus Acidoferrales bacterium]
MSYRGIGCRYVSDLIILASALILLTSSAYGRPARQENVEVPGAVPIAPEEQFSPSFLGMYRKVMLIDRNVEAYSKKYDVNLALARAVCMYESGGNAGLRSVAGARGYFQLMPSTFRSLRVRTNIEAGIKYLGQLVQWFGSENDAVAAYNGGPTRVTRGRILPLETRQYVVGVSGYRDVLAKYGSEVREEAGLLHIAIVKSGDDWWDLSRRLKLPLVQLRLYNPFLATRTLRPGYRIAYPLEPQKNLFKINDGTLYYRIRLGDNPISLAFALGVDPDALRNANNLDLIEAVAPDTLLQIPLQTPKEFRTYRVAKDDDLADIAQRMKIDPWAIVRDNLLWDQQVRPGMVLRIRQAAFHRRYVIHRVRRGETLGLLARRYHTTIVSIQRANRMGRSTRIRAGQHLRVYLR